MWNEPPSSFIMKKYYDKSGDSLHRKGCNYDLQPFLLPSFIIKNITANREIRSTKKSKLFVKRKSHLTFLRHNARFLILTYTFFKEIGFAL
jgi:hypothetical protein